MGGPKEDPTLGIRAGNRTLSSIERGILYHGLWTPVNNPLLLVALKIVPRPTYERSPPYPRPCSDWRTSEPELA